MKQLLEGKVLQMLPVSGGIVAAVLTDITEDDKLVVEYRMISKDTNEVQRVSKNVFLLVKFGPNHKMAEMQVKNHLTCRAAALEQGKVFIVEEDGSAKLLSEYGTVEWVGTVKYKDEVPSTIVFDGKNIWAAFTENNTVVRFGGTSFREELRIVGKEERNDFKGPMGVFALDENIYISNKTEKAVWKINTKTFESEEYLKLEEPVYGYMRLEQRDIVWLEQGIFEV